MSIGGAQLDFDEFHKNTLPGLLTAGNGALAAADLKGVPPIAFRVAGEAGAYTYEPRDDTVAIVPGDEGADTVVEMALETWQDYATELRSCYGLLYGDLVSFSRGKGFALLDRWEPPIRAMFHGRPVYRFDDPPDLTVDLIRTFTLDDPASELADFIDQAGFLHVKGVFSTDELAPVAEEVARLQAAATPDDGKSWWAKDVNGNEVCCRLIYCAKRSEPMRALAEHPRLKQLAAVTGLSLKPSLDRLDGQNVVIKHPDVVEGLSDLPWHRDCGLGGHPVLCPGLNVGIQLDAATPENGQLHVLPGSHRYTCHQLGPADEERLPVLRLTTEPGDVTLHYSHIFHAAPPPGGKHNGRRTIYSRFSGPRVFETLPEGKGYNDVLFTKTDGGRVRSVEEMQ